MSDKKSAHIKSVWLYFDGVETRFCIAEPTDFTDRTEYISADLVEAKVREAVAKTWEEAAVMLKEFTPEEMCFEKDVPGAMYFKRRIQFLDKARAARESDKVKYEKS